MQILRQELIGALKTRSELIKQKLTAIAIIGSAGVGLTGNFKVPYFSLVLCCIPFVCLYIDALIYHHSLATHMIGTFIRRYNSSNKSDNEVLADYEKWSLNTQALSKKTASCNLKHHSTKLPAADKFSWTQLERLVVHWSSIVFCLFIVVYAIIHAIFLYNGRGTLNGIDKSILLLCDVLISTFSLLGVFALWAVRRQYVLIKILITEQAPQILQEISLE